MIKIVFKNLPKSDLLKNIATKKIAALYSKFPNLKNKKIVCTLAMRNSITQQGPEEFLVKVLVHEGNYRNIGLQKKSKNLHKSLIETIDRMHERLKRHDEKKRRTQRSHSRKSKQNFLNISSQLTSTNQKLLNEVG